MDTKLQSLIVYAFQNEGEKLGSRQVPSSVYAFCLKWLKRHEQRLSAMALELGHICCDYEGVLPLYLNAVQELCLLSSMKKLALLTSSLPCSNLLSYDFLLPELIYR